MREIKFKAWDKEENLFLEDDEFVIDNNGKVYRWLNNNTLELIEHFVELLQYTGLKDKNGVEIYEGDIVLYSEGTKMIVMYQAPKFIMKEKEKNKTWHEFIKAPWDLQFEEVIGNKCENPELLEAHA